MVTEKINAWQATALLTITIIPTALLFPPSYLAKLSGRDAWLAFLIAGISGLLLALFITLLSSSYPNFNLFQIGEAVMGRFLGKFLVLAYSSFFIIMCSIAIRKFASFMVASFMPYTPLEVLSVIMVAMAMFAIYNGLEVIGRVSEVVFILIVTSLIVIIILSIQELNFRDILPVVDSGTLPVFRGSIVFFAWTGEVFFLAMLYPHLNCPGQAWKAGLIAVSIVSFFLIAGAMITESYFGFQLTSRLLFPLLTYVRVIGLAAFWERIDALVILIWVAGIYIRASFVLYITSISIKQLFNLADYRPIIFPLGALIFILSIIMFENTLELYSFMRDSWPFYAPIFILILPLLFYLTHIIKKAFRLIRSTPS